MSKLRPEKEEEEAHIIRLESSVQDLDSIVWDNNTGNVYIDTAEVFDDGVGGFILIEDNKYEVRMPNRLMVKKFKQLRKKADMKKKTIKVTASEVYSLEDQMEEMMNDMIIGFDLDSPELRLDDFQYNQISEFCWVFYNFFVKRSQAQMEERRSSLKEE